MKKTYIGFAGLSLLLLLGTQTVQAQQGFGTDNPHRSAAVDIQSSKRGLLIPRVSLVETTNQEPITAPETSLMVYNIATSKDVTPGYYYWDGDKWARFAKQSEITEIELKGDVTGKTGDTKVVAIQGTSISNVAPTANQVLTYIPSADGKTGEWVPTNLPTEPWNVQGTTTAASKNNEDIYQQGKVAIGFTKDDVATKTLDVKGDFRTVAKNGDVYSGFETNLFDEDVKTTTNFLYSSKSPINSLSDFVSSNEIGGIYTINSGVATIAKNNKNTVILSLGTVSSTHFDISLGGGYVDENKDQYSANLWGTSEQWLLSHIKKGKSVQVRVEGDKGVTFKHEQEGYTFPMTKGNTNQILVTDGGISDSGKNISKLEWKNAIDILTPGEPNQILITSKEGDKVTWVDQSDIVPITTNTLTKKDNNDTVDSNTIVSTVNGVPAEVKLIDNVTNTVNGTTIVTSVNGVESDSVDLKDVIQAGQKVTTVVNGTNTTVSSSVNPAGGNTTEYKVNVSNEAIQAAQKLTTVSEGKGVKVTLADKGNNTTDYNVAINTDGGKAGDVLTVVDGETSGDTKVEWKTPNYENIYTHDGTLTGNRTVDFGKNISLIFKRGNQSHDFTYDSDHTGLNMYGDKTSSIGLISHIKSSNGIESLLKLSHDNEWSHIYSSADKGFKLSTYYSKNISFETYATYDGDSSASVNFVIQGDGGVQVPNINEPKFAGKSTDKVVVADENGVLKTVAPAKTSMPKVFYMPPILFDTSVLGDKPVLDLHAEYVKQFKVSDNKLRSANSPVDIPTLGANELYYYITHYDSEVLEIKGITEDGKLSYKVKSNANEATFMTIVFVVK
ncbi:hypothetical protein GJV76_14460 [Myroides sp. BIT-d1]|uniref:Uncharacterized protein n=1 Tax=Myroides albus TaxID=2562892 RepID=A0A6I3LI86_9FLAO|nr:hypothetical protein [Myroides albus]MTG99309.1 hypothetical protein [Myroides albus]